MIWCQVGATPQLAHENVSKFSWCSGYHICLTHRRSPVRSRAKTAVPRGLTARISGFHPGGPGSTPGVGTLFPRGLTARISGFHPGGLIRSGCSLISFWYYFNFLHLGSSLDLFFGNNSCSFHHLVLHLSAVHLHPVLLVVKPYTFGLSIRLDQILGGLNFLLHWLLLSAILKKNGIGRFWILHIGLENNFVV